MPRKWTMKYQHLEKQFIGELIGAFIDRLWHHVQVGCYLVQFSIAWQHKKKQEMALKYHDFPLCISVVTIKQIAAL